MTTDVQTKRDERTLLVTLNRPEARNALTRGVLEAVTAALVAADQDDGVRCVVLTGAGGHFCAGADLRQTIMEDPDLYAHLEDHIDRFHRMLRAVVHCQKPTIAMLDGCAVGFGADLALACDLRIATTGAYIQEKFVKIGLMPDGGGTFWLPRLIGTARAFKAMYLAEKLEAKELYQLGVLADLVEPAALLSTTLGYARALEASPPLAVRAIKRTVYANLGEFDAALDREREHQLTLLRSSDAMEGILAWSEKRDPVFQGR